MKTYIIPLCLICCFLLSVNYGCEKADIQKPIDSSQTPIQQRTTCNDCDSGECCSSVTNLEGSITLTFCGVNSTSMSSTPCSDNHFGNCPISGYEWTFLLGASPATEIFCVPQGSSFSVTSTGSGSVRITCQYGQFSPVSIDLYFPGTNYVYVDDECVVSGHCPF